MEDKVEGLLSFCSEIDFGAVTLSGELKEFCSEMNDEVISFCKSLPESTQADALLFFMRYFRIPFGRDISVFTNYYAPAWSVIYWLIKSAPVGNGLEKEDRQNAKVAHSMALLLHPLDDHLNDGQLPITHMTLLLRSQCWMLMNTGLNRLADRIDGGKEITRKFIDDYYSGIKNSKEMVSLDCYCDRFRKQMATWLIVPVLISKRASTDEQFVKAVQTAYESFGISWRLLDDINDIQIDMTQGAHSSVYTCLPEQLKGLWDEGDEDKKASYARDILDYIVENGVIDRIKHRICSELESAVSISDGHDMTGLADEFRCLMNPLRNNWKDL